MVYSRINAQPTTQAMISPSTTCSVKFFAPIVIREDRGGAQAVSPARSATNVQSSQRGRRPTRPFQRPPADPEGESEARDRADELSAFLADRVAEVERWLGQNLNYDPAE